MEIAGHIDEVREAIKLGQFVNEAAVCQGVVLRLLGALGWPVFDPMRVAPEYAVEGRRVDLALCHPANKPLVFVEVKQVGKSEGADRQLFEYAFHLGVPMAVLTDGGEWHFFLPAEQGNYSERRVYRLNLLERDSDECVARLRRYLGYEDVCSGRALDQARLDYQDVSRERQIRAVLSEAWAKLIEEPDKLLVELVADKVESLCGYKPDPDAVTEYLFSLAGAATELGTKTEMLAPDVVVSPTQPESSAVESSKAAIDFTLKGQQFVCNSARDVLLQLFEELSRRDRIFCERLAARPKHGSKRRYVARSKYDLYPGRRDLAEGESCQLANGWWVGTNHSRRSIQKIVEMACEVAGLRLGRDLVVRLG